MSDHDANLCIRRAAPLISKRSGLITGVHELRNEPDDARLFYTFTRVAHTSRYAPDAPDCYQQNGGAGLTSAAARAAAIGETIERYSSSVYAQHEMLLGTWRDLQRYGLDALHPGQYPTFTARQFERPGFPYVPFTEETPLRWVPGWSLTRGTKVWIPATLVHVPYFPAEPEPRILDSVSTGLACATDPWTAIQSGIQECIERDAVMITWFAGLPAPRIDLRSDAAFERLYEERFSGTGVEFMLFDLTLDLPAPVMFGLALDRHREGLALAVGAACSLNVRRAATKALVEAAQGRVWLKFMRRRREPWDYGDDFDNIRSFEDHVQLFGRLDMLESARFLIDQPPALPLSDPGSVPEDPKGQVLQLVRLLADVGLETIVADVTSPDVAALGFTVMKAIVPGLQELNADYRHRMLGSRRLYEVPRTTGHSSRLLTEQDLNPIPHPFP